MFMLEKLHPFSSFLSLTMLKDIGFQDFGFLDIGFLRTVDSQVNFIIVTMI